MIIELHLPVSKDILLLAAWEFNSAEFFAIFQKKIDFECKRYKYHIGLALKHDSTGNIIYILSAEQEDFEHIQNLLNNYANNNKSHITILVD